MGDLKKKKVDYIAKTEDGEEILIEQDEIQTDEQTIERLREYMRLFAKKQKEKQKDEDE